MQGNPADMAYATTYSGDRIGGLGNMPFSVLREKVKALQNQ